LTQMGEYGSHGSKTSYNGDVTDARQQRAREDRTC